MDNIVGHEPEKLIVKHFGTFGYAAWLTFIEKAYKTSNDGHVAQSMIDYLKDTSMNMIEILGYLVLKCYKKISLGKIF